MADKLLKMDYERGKAIVLRTTVGEDGRLFEEQIEINLPKLPMGEGTIRKIKRDEEGRMYEVEEKIQVPIFNKDTKGE